MNDWQYHQDGRDEAVGKGCLGLILMSVISLAAFAALLLAAFTILESAAGAIIAFLGFIMVAALVG